MDLEADRIVVRDREERGEKTNKVALPATWTVREKAH